MYLKKIIEITLNLNLMFILIFYKKMNINVMYLN